MHIHIHTYICTYIHLQSTAEMKIFISISPSDSILAKASWSLHEFWRDILSRIKKKKRYLICLMLPIIVDSHKLFLVHSPKYSNLIFVFDEWHTFMIQCLHFVLWCLNHSDSAEFCNIKKILSYTYSFKTLCQNHWKSPCESRVLVDHGDTFQVHWEKCLVLAVYLCEKEVETKPSPQTEHHGAEFLQTHRLLTKR